MLLERLGLEAADPVEEFLALALSYEREHVPSLQVFFAGSPPATRRFKRDFGAKQRDEVRILTVHGAKGLEAPVVFLPDTMQLPNLPDTLLWTEREGCRCGCPRADLAVPFLYQRKRALRERHLQEYRRLLYVALSRGRPALYLRLANAGSAQGRLMARTLPHGFHRDCDSFSLRHGGFDWRRWMVRPGSPLTSSQAVAPVRERPAAAVAAAGPLPTGCIARRQPSPTRRGRSPRRG